MLCQLNAALAVDEWHAFKVIDHFCTNVLPKLSEAELVNYLRPYRLDSIDAYRCAVLTRDARYDAGFDEVPLLDASFNVHTSLFFSVGKVRAVHRFITLAPLSCIGFPNPYCVASYTGLLPQAPVHPAAAPPAP